VFGKHYPSAFRLRRRAAYARIPRAFARRTRRVNHTIVTMHVEPAGIALCAIVAFLLGSIPFGVVISRLFYRRDIRQSGSGNIGAMNALRTLGKTGAIAVLLLDAAKGVVPPALVFAFFHSAQLAAIVAACAVLGHCFSPWLRFRGGK